jgi:hypothetical protein
MVMMQKARVLLLKKKLGQSDNSGINVDLINDGVLMWIGIVEMGQAATPINVVFDTGSDWLVV